PTDDDSLALHDALPISFSEQITQQIRQSKRHQKRIEIFAGAEETSKHHLANQSEQATRQNRHADDSCRACASSPIFDRSHRRTKDRKSTRLNSSHQIIS